MRLNRFVLLLALMILFVLGCQSSDFPTTPDNQTISPDRPVSQTSAGNRSLWGYFNCEADLESGAVSVIPNRSSDLHINATKPINNSLGIGFSVDPSSTPATGYFVINVSITHPFAGSPTFTGFDVRGILLGYGNSDAGGIIIPGTGDIQLVNADGFSRWWNPSEFTTAGLFGYEKGMFSIHAPSGHPTAMVNPYKIFSDGLWATADASILTTVGLTEPNGRSVFCSGKTNTRQYQIQFAMSGGPKIQFDYAIDASWAESSPNPPVNIPGDFPIWANAMEPFLIESSVDDCSVLGTLFGGAASGEIEVTLEVWDWQGWNAGSYDGQIGDVRFYSPGIVFDTPTVEQVDGLHYTTLSITASALEATTGSYPVLIEISVPGTAWKQTSAIAPDGETAVYTMINAAVGTMECTADFNNICEEAVSVDIISTTSGAVCMPFDGTDYFTFTVGTGTAMDGTITLDNFNYGDNDLLLFDGCPGDIIDMSMTPYGEDEVIEVEMLETGLYYIAILTGETSGTDVQPYELIVNLEQSGQLCTADNNNESTEAVTIDLVDEITESVCAGGDIRDWYKIVVPAFQAAGGSVYLNNAGLGNIDIRIYEEYPGPITFWGTNLNTQDELVSISGLSPGAHYMEVFAMGGTPAGDRGYTLSTNLISAEYECTSGDGNDPAFTADVVNYTSEEIGTICFPGDPDWFVFEVPADKSVSGTITLSGNSMTDNDLYFYGDPDAEPLDYSAQTGLADEQVILDDIPSGIYYMRCSAHPNVGMGDQPYTLTLDLEEENIDDFDFEIHAHIFTENDGSNPATTETRVQNDVDWADEFYSQWGGSFTLAEISYIAKSSYLAATQPEMFSCHSIYKDKSGPINVYYCNSFPDTPSAAAYCRMDCRPLYHTHNSTFVAMSDVALNRVLAHELGHATGLFHDVYLLDMGYTSCAHINQDYCPPGSNLAFCDESDAAIGNMMWFSVQGWNDPEDYWLSTANWQNPEKPIDSQVENWVYFQTNYVNNF